MVPSGPYATVRVTLNRSCVRALWVELTVSCPFFPMVVEKECIGVVMALNKIGAPTFTAEDEQVKMHVFTPSLRNNV